MNVINVLQYHSFFGFLLRSCACLLTTKLVEHRAEILQREPEEQDVGSRILFYVANKGKEGLEAAEDVTQETKQAFEVKRKEATRVSS